MLELQEAISSSKAPSSIVGTGAYGGGQETAANSQSKVEGSGRSRNLKPYVANVTDFILDVDVQEQLRTLRQENELLRHALTDRSNPRAFEKFLRLKNSI